MGTLNPLSLGWLTPALSYLTACAGAALGLRCALRGLAASGAARRNGLVTAATAIGSGIGTRHFVAMFGFTVDDTELRYDCLGMAVAAPPAADARPGPGAGRGAGPGSGPGREPDGAGARPGLGRYGAERHERAA